jgi:hypothetical protein
MGQTYYHHRRNVVAVCFLAMVSGRNDLTPYIQPTTIYFIGCGSYTNCGEHLSNPEAGDCTDGPYGILIPGSACYGPPLQRWITLH